MLIERICQEIKCAICHDKGQKKAYCPKIKNKVVVNTSCEDSNNEFPFMNITIVNFSNEWIMNFACDYHMSFNIFCFTNLDTPIGEIIYIGEIILVKW